MSARQPNLFEFDQNIFETNSTSAYESDEVNQGNKS